MNTSQGNSVVNTTVDYIRSGNIFSQTLLTVAYFVLFAFGTFIHVKIVSTCRKEKDKTWQIDITHSIGMAFVFFYAIIFERLIDNVPDLHLYTGVWVCYVTGFFYLFGTYVILFHSLVISLMKYVFIVHQKTVRQLGEEKFKRIFFITNIFHPLFLTISSLLLLDFEAYSGLIQCFDLKKELIERYNTTTGNLERMFFCKLNSEEYESFYFIKQGFCAGKMIWVLAFSCNIPESFFYYKIFRKIKR